MGAKRQALFRFRIEFLHQVRPQKAGRAELRHLHEEIHADRPEERQARRELVHREPRADSRAQIFDAVSQSIGEFEILGRARFLHVIAGDRDRVEFRHMLRGEGENVGNDPHRMFGRIDIGVPHHEFFQDIVLDRAGELFGGNALLFRRHDVKREHRQDRPVHGHRHRHLVERNAGKQRPHVIDRIDGDARHADISGDAGMVGIVAAMGGEVECDRQALLARGEIAPVKGVRIFRRGEAGILPHRPRLVDIHGRVRPAQKRRDAGEGIDRRQAFDIFRAIDAFHRDAFGRQPRFDGKGRRRSALILRQGEGREIGNAAHSGFRRPGFSRKARFVFFARGAFRGAFIRPSKKRRHSPSVRGDGPVFPNARRPQFSASAIEPKSSSLRCFRDE